MAGQLEIVMFHNDEMGFPYSLTRDIRGIGFKTAEQMAERMGIERDSVRQARAGMRDFAVVKTPEAYLWDVREPRAGDVWQLKPVPKAAKKAFKALA